MATKAELIGKAESLGLEVTDGMTVKEIQALIDAKEQENGGGEEGAGDANAVMLRNVKHDGTFYKKDERVMLAEDVLDLFLKNGHAQAAEGAGKSTAKAADEDKEEGDES